MASWVQLTLDTTPPSFSVDSVTPAEAGTSFTVDFTLSDGNVTGQLPVPGSIINGSVTGNQMTFDVPETVPQGTYTIAFTVMDDVGNWQGISEQIFIESDVVVVTPPGGSTGEEFVYGGGPWMKRFDIGVPGTASLEREKVFAVSANARYRESLRLTQSIPATVSRSIPFEMEFAASRTDAAQWTRLIQEDEEVLLHL